MIARPFSLYYNAFNMKVIHAFLFCFVLHIKTLFRGQSRGKRPVLDLNLTRNRQFQSDTREQ